MYDVLINIIIKDAFPMWMYYTVSCPISRSLKGLSGRRSWKVVPENGGSLDLKIGRRSDW